MGLSPHLLPGGTGNYIRYGLASKACPVWPGRGSAARLLVAYPWGSTALDPVEHGLLFRALPQPGAPSMP